MTSSGWCRCLFNSERFWTTESISSTRQSGVCANCKLGLSLHYQHNRDWWISAENLQSTCTAVNACYVLCYFCISLLNISVLLLHWLLLLQYWNSLPPSLHNPSLLSGHFVINRKFFCSKRRTSLCCCDFQTGRYACYRTELNCCLPGFSKELCHMLVSQLCFSLSNVVVWRHRIGSSTDAVKDSWPGTALELRRGCVSWCWVASCRASGSKDKDRSSADGWHCCSVCISVNLWYYNK